MVVTTRKITSLTPLVILCIDTETVGTITNLLALNDTDAEFTAASGGAYTFTGVEPVDADDYVAGKAPCQ